MFVHFDTLISRMTGYTEKNLVSLMLLCGHIDVIMRFKRCHFSDYAT